MYERIRAAGTDAALLGHDKHASRGLHRPYVVLTRAVQILHIVHAELLPAALQVTGSAVGRSSGATLRL